MFLESLIIRVSRMAYRKGFIDRCQGFFLIFLIFFLPLLLVSLYAYVVLSEHLNEMVFSRRQAIALPVAKSLNSELDSLVNFGLYIASNTEIQEKVREKKWKEAYDITVPYLTLSEEKSIERFFFSDENGMVFAGSAAPATTTPTDFSHRDWYKGIMRTGKPYISEVFVRQLPPKMNVVNIATPIFTEKHLISGILVMQVDPSNFLHLFKNIEIGNNGFAYVLDQYGKVVVHPKFPKEEKIIDFSSSDVYSKIKAKGSGVDHTFNNVENEWRLSAYETVGDYGWSVVIQEPLGSAYKEKDDILKIFIILVGAIFLFYALVADGVVRAVRKLDESNRFI